MFNFNNYEIMHEPKEIDPDCEYIYVTDNEALKSDNWKIIIDHSLDKLSIFDKCYAVKFNLFKYATTDVCIYLDASVQINKSLKKLYDDFISSDADLGLNIHPDVDNVYDEYIRWIYIRNYPKQIAEKRLTVMSLLNYNIKYKGLYQTTCRICKNTELNKEIDTTVLNTLKMMGENGIIERQNQNVYSFVLNRLFSNIKVFSFSQQVLQSEYMTWMWHNSNNAKPYNKNNDKKEGYLFNKLTNLYYI